MKIRIMLAIGVIVMAFSFQNCSSAQHVEEGSTEFADQACMPGTLCSLASSDPKCYQDASWYKYNESFVCPK